MDVRKLRGVSDKEATMEMILNVTHSIEEAVAIRQTTAFANYMKQVEQVISETHE
jgi:hypothetical protein